MASGFQEIQISHLVGDRQSVTVSELKELFRDNRVKLVSGMDWEVLKEYHAEATELHRQLIQTKAEKKDLEQRNQETTTRVQAALKAIATTTGFQVKEGEDNLLDSYLNGLIAHITRHKETEVYNYRPPGNPQTSAEAARNVSSSGGGIPQIIGMRPTPDVSLRSSSALVLGTTVAPVLGTGNRYAASNQDNQRGSGITIAPTVVPDLEIQVLSHTKLIERNRNYASVEIKAEPNPALVDPVIRTPAPPCFVITNESVVNDQHTQVDHDTTATASSSPTLAAEVEATPTAEISRVLSAPSTVSDGITNQSSVRPKQRSRQSMLHQKAAPKSVKLQRQAKGCSSKMEPNQRAYNGEKHRTRQLPVRVVKKPGNFQGKHAVLTLGNRSAMIRWQCTCGCSYKLNSELQAHLAYWNSNKKFKCDKEGCEKKYAQLRRLNVHLLDVHRVRVKPYSRFGCRFCGKYFPTRGAITTHRLERCYDKPGNKSLDASQLPEAELRLDPITLPEHGRAPGTSSRRHRCLCGLTFDSNDLLEVHIGYP